jgi:NADH-quinone oxidoreductase subunit E
MTQISGIRGLSLEFALVYIRLGRISLAQGKEIVDRIDAVIDRYGSKRSALIQVLLDVQKEERWLPGDVLRRISGRLEVPLPQVYQVATFYKAFSLAPRGRHLVTVCMGTACHVRRSPMLLDRVSQRLGIRAGKTTEDNRFTLLTVNCMGCCALGPVMEIDETYYSNPSASDLKRILARYE